MDSHRPDDVAVARDFLFALDAFGPVSHSSTGGDEKTRQWMATASYLARHGQQPSTRQWAAITARVLDAGMFTESNLAVARAGLGAIAAGRPSEDTTLADVVTSMGGRSAEMTRGQPRRR